MGEDPVRAATTGRAATVSPAERDYVLGTDDREVLRLGIQHSAWRDMALACWQRAGVREGDRVIDVGAGPGFCALELSRVVGSGGHVTAVERSARFVAAGKAAVEAHGLNNVTFMELDLMADAMPEKGFDAAWCRWVASFVTSPATLVDRIAGALRPGGVAMFQEYVDYASWRFSPALPLTEAYITRVMRSWRAAGGEPDVAASLPPLLHQRGFTIEHAVPHIFCVRPGEPLWTWISTFIASNVDRLVALGYCEWWQVDNILAEFRDAAGNPETLMLTPMVLEIVARKHPEQVQSEQ